MAARKYGAGLNIIDSDGWHSLKFQKITLPPKRERTAQPIPADCNKTKLNPITDMPHNTP